MTTPLRTAIVYDFDGTLAPRNLPEHTFLPAVGIEEPEAFWAAVKQEAQAQDGCEILAYMHRMLEVARAKGVNVMRATCGRGRRHASERQRESKEIGQESRKKGGDEEAAKARVIRGVGVLGASSCSPAEREGYVGGASAIPCRP